MNNERVEAAAKAFDKAFAEEMLSGRSPSANDWKVAGLRAALTAADSASGERGVVRMSAKATKPARYVLSAADDPSIESYKVVLQPGEELVVRKVRGG